MDPEVLINEVFARPPLWDRSSPAHSNRDIVAGLWKEVADACGISCEVAKSKWKHLRDHFRCELKRCVRSRAGKGGRYRSSWVWFWPLVFLKDQMLQPRFRDRDRDRDDSAPDDDASAPSGGDDNPPDVKGEPLGARPACQAPERDFLDLDRRSLLLLDEPLPAPHAPHASSCDDTEHFLLSLAPAVRTLPLARQMLLRLKVQELVSNEVIAAQGACNPAPDARALGGPDVVEAALEIPEIDHSWTPGEDVAADVQSGWESPKK